MSVGPVPGSMTSGMEVSGSMTSGMEVSGSMTSGMEVFGSSPPPPQPVRIKPVAKIADITTAPFVLRVPVECMISSSGW